MYCTAAYKSTKVCSLFPLRVFFEKGDVKKTQIFFLQRKSIHFLIFEALVAKSFSKLFFCPLVMPLAARDHCKQYIAD
jgi:hypothetical protein